MFLEKHSTGATSRLDEQRPVQSSYIYANVYGVRAQINIAVNGLQTVLVLLRSVAVFGGNVLDG